MTKVTSNKLISYQLLTFHILNTLNNFVVSVRIFKILINI